LTPKINFADQLRLNLSQKGETEVDSIENDEKEAIIAHLQNRLKITEQEHDTFIEKRK